MNTATTGDQLQPKVAFDSDGAFMVSWWSDSAVGDGSGTGVVARQFDRFGAPLGPDFRVNTYTTGSQGYPSVAGGPRGQFTVAWGGASQTDTSGVSAQRYGDLIFADAFDWGNLEPWQTFSTGGGDLSAWPAAAIESPPWGLQAVVNDTAGLFVQDDTPADETHYRARFTFDPNDFDPGISQNHLRTRLFIGFSEAPNRRLFAIVLRKQAGGEYSLLGRVRRDVNVQVDTGFTTITNAPHSVEIDVVTASGPGAGDGMFEMWIDGTSVAKLSGLQTSAGAVDFVRLGAMNAKTGAAGTLYFDDFESRRRTAIGPIS